MYSSLIGGMIMIDTIHHLGQFHYFDVDESSQLKYAFPLLSDRQRYNRKSKVGLF